MSNRDTIDELERLCTQGLELVRDARPRAPHADAPLGGWIWSSTTRECDWPTDKPPFGLQPGDDLELMFHGGSTARGNLHSAQHWPLVTAYAYHGKIPHSNLDEIHRMVWESRPGINRSAVA